MNQTSTGEEFVSPFQTPLFNIDTLVGGEQIFSILFLLIFTAWAAYTIIAAYHWFRYSHRSWLAIPAVVVHLAISGTLILFIASGV